MGSILVIPSFMGIFIKTPGFLNTQASKNIWYCVLPAIFNIGWASVQISHMSIVNTLSYSQRRRDQMVNSRNSFTYAANITVLTVSLLLFIVINKSTTQFTVLCLMCISVGALSTLFYSFNIQEKPLILQAKELEAQYRLTLIEPDNLLQVNKSVLNDNKSELSSFSGNAD